jgi:epoxyqueuosine reductase
VASGTAKWLYRHSCQEVCPWNARCSRELQTPEFALRDALAGRDARELAREILQMRQSEFRAGFKGSLLKRANLRGLTRNAAVLAAALER